MTDAVGRLSGEGGGPLTGRMVGKVRWQTGSWSERGESQETEGTG